MPFVKLDTGMLHSTLWVERECRELFITALLMAEPMEIVDPMPQMKVCSMEQTGFVVPPGWYGFVKAAGVGIIRQALVERDVGLIALEALGSPDTESRSKDFDGRRLVRVDGGFIVLNYMKYREKDATAADRARRYRLKQKLNSSRVTITPSHRDNTASRDERHHAEAEAEAEVKPKSKAGASLFAPPSLTEVSAYVTERKSRISPQAFLDFYESKGWRVGNQPMKDWRAAVRTWEQRELRDKGPEPERTGDPNCKICDGLGLRPSQLTPGRYRPCACVEGK